MGVVDETEVIAEATSLLAAGVGPDDWRRASEPALDIAGGDDAVGISLFLAASEVARRRGGR